MHENCLLRFSSALSESLEWEQYQVASTIFEFFEGWERAFVDDDSGLVIIEGAGFAPGRQYVCIYYDNAVIEVNVCQLNSLMSLHAYVQLHASTAFSSNDVSLIRCEV